MAYDTVFSTIQGDRRKDKEDVAIRMVEDWVMGSRRGGGELINFFCWNGRA